MAAIPRARTIHAYHLYGLCLRSEWPLPYSREPASSLAEVGLFRGSRARFCKAIGEARTAGHQTTWTRGVALADGQTYVRWPGRAEFLISADGHSIAARPFRPNSREAFRTYLLGQALSFALIKQGFDPLHATVVSIDGAAVAFLGDSGYGKSSLAAAFVEAGHRLVTDDLLVVTEEGSEFSVHPGPPRIKLFPKIARRLLGPQVRGRRIVSGRPKLVIPLDGCQACRTVVPLRAVYVIAPARSGLGTRRVTIRHLTSRQACLELIRNAFNTAVIEPARLRSQFAMATIVAARVPVKRISYPRRLGLLTTVRDVILADLAR